jgi:hypothetical protein
MHNLARLAAVGTVMFVLSGFARVSASAPNLRFLVTDGNQSSYIETVSQDAPKPESPVGPVLPPKPAPKHPGKYSHVNDFLIRGTVFTDILLAFPSVQLRVRRTGEKKFRWETYTNSRGEFAVRVPQGAQYELAVHAKGFTDQTSTIDARTGDIHDNVVFRMQPAGGKK